MVGRLAHAAAESVDLGIVVSAQVRSPRDFHALLGSMRGVVRLSALEAMGPGPRLAKPGVVSSKIVIGVDDPMRVPTVFARLLTCGHGTVHLVPTARVLELLEARNGQDLQVRSSDEPRNLQYGTGRHDRELHDRWFGPDADDDDGEHWGEGFHFGPECPDALRRLVTD